MPGFKRIGFWRSAGVPESNQTSRRMDSGVQFGMSESDMNGIGSLMLNAAFWNRWRSASNFESQIPKSLYFSGQLWMIEFKVYEIRRLLLVVGFKQ